MARVGATIVGGIVEKSLSWEALLEKRHPHDHHNPH